MSGSESVEKGKRLERAVEAVENVILQQSPSYNNETFNIESRKLLERNGVQHEVDIWVEVELARGYTAQYMFECRNRAESVGSSQVQQFREEVRQIGAHHGFFVARSYTSGAVSQAEGYNRVSLITATELPTGSVPVPFGMHYITDVGMHLEVTFSRADAEGGDRKELPMEGTELRLEGKQLDIKEFCEKLSRDLRSQRLSNWPSDKLTEGIYELEAEGTWKYNNEELIVDGIAVDKVHILAKMKQRIDRPAIQTHFDIQNRGRVIGLEPLEVEGGEVRVGFVAAPEEN